MNTDIKIMAHAVCGYPDRLLFQEVLNGFKDGGADILELQIPFSDPTADGPVITDACEGSIKNGFRVRDVFECIAHAHKTGFKEIFVMSYANIVYVYGIEKFVNDMKSAGVTGLIVPDFPIEDDDGFYDTCRRAGIIAMPVAVINMADERINLLKQKTSGNIYLSIRVGITGSQTIIDDKVKHFISKFSDISVYAGFGICCNEQIKQLEGIADAAVVGSYFTKIIKKCVEDGSDIRKTLALEVKKLKGEQN
ncbi:MAG: tryptophan synthase subunit alpha [Candidatus Omnitrophica bacterium]|nr:tryptophan synthase subunit alpha [Candidatus Omnitrophota bacterium]MDD5080689.1 tryptophan synthase subunit alpha [Candidatus Omnitrophota bacterium]MDD5440653.1 tryptophan synthase subunit alpha [Candidatus Omnitrophota bacterium]